MKHICGEIGGMSPMLIVAAVLGQMKLTKPQVVKAASRQSRRAVRSRQGRAGPAQRDAVPRQ